MGYFSYFSYFMRTFFNFKKSKKIIFILLIIILIIFAIKNNVFAANSFPDIPTYVCNNTTFSKCWGYSEGNGCIVVANKNTGIPYRNWFCGGSDTPTTWTFNNNRLNSLATSNRSWYRSMILKSGYDDHTYGPDGGATSYSGSIDIGNDNFILFSTNNIYNSDGSIYLEANSINTRYVSPPTITPYIVTNSSDIIDFSFDNLVINIGSYNFVSDGYYGLFITFTGTEFDYDYDVPIKDYYDTTTNTFVIPKRLLFSGLNIRTGNTIKFEINMRYNLNNYLFDLGSYTLNLTTEQEENINEDLQAQAIENLNNTQQETNNKIDNLNNTQQETNNKIDSLENTITDGSINDVSMSDLPQDSTQDITADGVNGIFTSIYNAFCTGEAQDIVFPIPFTDKNITLQANYVENNLRNSGASWVITIIQAFWWYIISRFIIKDIMDKINKIKGGNIENIETDNIRGDML